jgi:Anaerobic dehydrogenases, typically selenocysteine-containing
MGLKRLRTACPRDCFGGCTMNVYIENGKIVKVEGEDSSRATGGKLCSKGMAYTDYVYSDNRIKYPMVREGKRGEGSFRRVSWEYAAESICSKLSSIKENYGPLSLLYYASGGCGGMMPEYSGGFFNQFGGFTTTRGNLCYSQGIEGTKLTYGSARHNAPWDMENAGLIILWGKNPAYTNVHEMRFINNVISKGGKLITIDPIKTASSTMSSLHIPVKPGTDAVLALSVANLLISRNSIDSNFIRKFTHGFDELKSHVEKYTPEYGAEICGIDKADIYSIVELIENNKPMTLVCGYGVQRYKNGGQTVRAISILPALTGDVGIKGGGFRFANKLWRNLEWPFLPEGEFEVREDYPSSQLGRAIENHDNPPVKMLWVERANPLTMNPDTNGLKRAFDKLESIIVIDQFLTDTAAYADIVLPAQSFFEFTDIFESYWTPYISCFQKVIEPYYESKNEAQIYRMLGEHMGYRMEYLPPYNEDTLNMVLKRSGIGTTIEKLKISPYYEEIDEIAFKDRKFDTPSGKIELLSKRAEEKWKLNPLPEYKWVEGKYPLRFLSTHARERIHSQFGNIKRLTGGDDRVLIYMNSQDALSRRVGNEDRVDIFNDNGIIHAYVSITDNIKPGVVNIHEGLPERSGASVNILTSQDISDMGYGAVYYECFVEVRKCRE